MAMSPTPKPPPKQEEEEEARVRRARLAPTALKEGEEGAGASDHKGVQLHGLMRGAPPLTPKAAALGTAGPVPWAKTPRPGSTAARPAQA